MVAIPRVGTVWGVVGIHDRVLGRGCLGEWAIGLIPDSEYLTNRRVVIDSGELLGN
jgi:hypothetical protein